MTAEQLRQSISAHNPDARRARQNLITLRAEIARYEFSLGFELTNAGSGHPDEPRIGWVNQSEVLDSLARYQLAEKLILASPVAAEIPTLDALYERIAEAEERESAAAAVESAARVAVADAEEAARTKLLAKVAVDPGVIKAKADLSKFHRLGEPLPDLASDSQELSADLH
jgi:hypothetical protein